MFQNLRIIYTIRYELERVKKRKAKILIWDFFKVDMVTETEKRWPNYHSEIPNRMGVIEDIEKFDATFFGVRYSH